MKNLGIIRDQLIKDLKQAQLLTEYDSNAVDTDISDAYIQGQIETLEKNLDFIDTLIKTELNKERI